MVMHLYRNDRGQYKLMFRYLKLFRLMTYIEGDADQGFTITIDGQPVLFKASTPLRSRYRQVNSGHFSTSAAGD